MLVRFSGYDRTGQFAAHAPKLGNQRAVLVGDSNIIDTGSPGKAARLCGGAKNIAQLARLQEIDLALLGHGHNVV